MLLKCLILNGHPKSLEREDTMFRSMLMASALAALAAASYLGTIAAANAAGYNEKDLVVGCDPNDPINQNPPKCFPATKTLIDANGSRILHKFSIQTS